MQFPYFVWFQTIVQYVYNSTLCETLRSQVVKQILYGTYQIEKH